MKNFEDPNALKHIFKEQAREDYEMNNPSQIQEPNEGEVARNFIINSNKN